MLKLKKQIITFNDIFFLKKQDTNMEEWCELDETSEEIANKISEDVDRRQFKDKGAQMFPIL